MTTRNIFKMKRNYIIYPLCIMSVMVIIYGCKKSFLDRKPIGQDVIETYFDTEKHALEGVVGVYDPLGWERTYDKLFWALGDGGSDDTPLGLSRDDGSGSFVGITAVADYNNVASAAVSPAFEVMYKGYYEGIYRANLVIEKLEQSPISESSKARYIAECKTLRALYYYMLVNYFGGVPLFTNAIDPLDEEASKLPRSTAEEVYTQIEKDLTEAYDALPLRSATAAENMLGRITKGACNALLAKAYLAQKKYNEAATAAQSVIDQGEYGLNDDYYANFRQATANSIESVLEIQHNDNAVVDNGGGWGADAYDGSTGAVKIQACNGGWGQNRPSADLYNHYAPADQRRQYVAPTENDVIDGVAMCGTPTLPSTAKFIVLGKGEGTIMPRSDVAPVNRVLIRYSDVLLIKAEALAALAAAGSAPTDAITELLAVRSRAGLSAPSSSDYAAMNGTQLVGAIRNERRSEFGMEGWRLFDLRNWGADSLKNALMRVGKIDNGSRPWKDAYMLYPLPQSEIDLSGGAVIQNPGY